MNEEQSALPESCIPRENKKKKIFSKLGAYTWTGVTVFLWWRFFPNWHKKLALGLVAFAVVVDTLNMMTDLDTLMKRFPRDPIVSDPADEILP